MGKIWINKNLRDKICKKKLEHMFKYTHKGRLRGPGQLQYAIEYLLKPENINKFVKQYDVIQYTDYRRTQDTNGKEKGYKDGSRAIESMRKDKYPCMWIETIKNKDLYFKFAPWNKYFVNDTIIKNTNRKESFSGAVIVQKLEETKYTCEITGLSESEGGLAGDHWFPKEKGGKSEKENCVILNKILNEKKNNHMPIHWFCKTLLTNFMNVCKKTNMLEDCKAELKKFIDAF